MNAESYYKLDCAGCNETIQLPAIDGQANCPNCGATLLIHWNGAHADLGLLRERQRT